jgi:hypothetical protein
MELSTFEGKFDNSTENKQSKDEKIMTYWKVNFMVYEYHLKKYWNDNQN